LVDWLVGYQLQTNQPTNQLKTMFSMGFITRKLASYPRISKLYSTTKKVLLYLFIFQLVYTLLLIIIPVYITPTIIGQWLGGKSIHKEWVSLPRISEAAQKAVIAKEDQDFGEHLGFDLDEIEEAVEHNKTHKNKRGASTISQQVAKNVFLWQGRTWIRKGLEVYCTLVVELFWSKKRILEVYLNIAEMGDGIFGIEAAAQKFFGKPASKLNNEESALIAACLSNPIIFKVDAPSERVLKKQRWILRQMKNVEWER
jgi:monofunctional glycosyltransferase